jgi:DNA-binding response OmpR family regulator
MLDDKLAAFDCGADDYLVKPFALREVEARLQRAGGAAPRPRGGSPAVCYEAIEYDPAKHSVTVEGKPVHLSRKCLRLLEMLIAAPHRVLPAPSWSANCGARSIRRAIRCAATCTCCAAP